MYNVVTRKLAVDVRTFTVASGIHNMRQLDVVRRNDLIGRDVIVAELDFDSVAEWRKHV